MVKQFYDSIDAVISVIILLISIFILLLFIYDISACTIYSSHLKHTVIIVNDISNIDGKLEIILRCVCSLKGLDMLMILFKQ